MNVLSLFDGLGGARIALDRLGITPKRYFSSEIDKYAHGVAKFNYPDIISLGDVTKIDGTKLGQIDLLIGGSPCQSFSYAGKRIGMITSENIEIISLDQYLELKENNFQFEGQSYLFWEYVRLLKEVKPKYFLLENVRMAKKWSDVITKTLMVEPILINSTLVSAQNRKRLYWTNLEVGQPEDKNILLQDVIKDVVNEQYFTKPEFFKRYNKNTLSKKFLSTKRKIDENVYIFDPISWSRLVGVRKLINKSHTLNQNDAGTLNKNQSQTAVVYLINDEFVVRRLSAIERERLQTVPKNYTKFGKFDSGVSEISVLQRGKMLGNGFTIDVIAHILRGIKDDPKNTN